MFVRGHVHVHFGSKGVLGIFFSTHHIIRPCVEFIATGLTIFYRPWLCVLLLLPKRM